MGRFVGRLLDSAHHQTRRLASLGSVVSNLEIEEKIGKPVAKNKISKSVLLIEKRIDSRTP